MTNLPTMLAGMLLALLLVGLGPQQCASFEPPHPFVPMSTPAQGGLG